MTAGRLIAVVGPSGAGKDSILQGLAAAAPQMRLVRRVITRAPGLGGEAYEAVTPEAFRAAEARGAFCVSWAAHGLQYGIPAAVLEEVLAGADCIANVSRGALAEAAALFPRLTVLNVTADAAVLAERLAGRGRETPGEIADRLSRDASPLPEGIEAITIRNDGTLDEAVTAALAALQPVRA